MTRQDRREALPRHVLALASAAKPLEPRTLPRRDDELQTTKVAADAEVVEVPLKAPTQSEVLSPDRLMSMASTPVVDGLYRPSQARTASLARHPPATTTSSLPVESDPDEVESGRTFAAARRGLPEGQQPRLVRMQGQSEALHPFAKHRSRASARKPSSSAVTTRWTSVVSADRGSYAVAGRGAPIPGMPRDAADMGRASMTRLV